MTRQERAHGSSGTPQLALTKRLGHEILLRTSYASDPSHSEREKNAEQHIRQYAYFCIVNTRSSSNPTIDTTFFVVWMLKILPTVGD